MLKKIFLSVIALFFVLFGSLFLLMGYVFNNPEKVFSAFTSVTDRFLEGQDYHEKEEFFIQGIDTLQITGLRGTINLFIYDGPTLKLETQGKVPRFEQGPFILQNAEGDVLTLKIAEPQASHWIQMHVNGEEVTRESNSELQSTVYLPEKFKGRIILKTSSGGVNIKLAENQIYELDLQSQTGTISNTLKQKPTSNLNQNEVGSIKVTTQSGPITVEAL